jgi:hypothetical protein
VARCAPETLAARTLGTVACQLAEYAIAAWCVPFTYRRERKWSLCRRRLMPRAVGDVRQRLPIDSISLEHFAWALGHFSAVYCCNARAVRLWHRTLSKPYPAAASPAKILQTDLALALYTAPLIANSGARGSAQATACRAHHWLACSPSSA